MKDYILMVNFSEELLWKSGGMFDAVMYINTAFFTFVEYTMYIQNTRWGKSRFTVVHMENSIIKNK